MGETDEDCRCGRAIGMVGRHIVPTGTDRGHDVVALNRSAGVDLTTGDRLTDRLAEVDVVIDAANSPVRSTTAAERFFGGVTRNLLAAETNAGVRHHVALSVIGADRVPGGYYAGKFAARRIG